MTGAFGNERMRAEDYERKHRAFLASAQLRYPWQFRDAAGRAVEVDVTVGSGWHRLLFALFDRVSESLQGSARERFWWWRIHCDEGCLRVDFNGGGPAIRRAVDLARRQAADVCQVCGGPGRLRQVDGMFATECESHYLIRIAGHASSDPFAARVWLTTPRADLRGRSPRTAVGCDDTRDAVLEAALRRALPGRPALSPRQRRWLAGAWKPLAALFGDRLQDLRIAEPAGGRTGQAVACLMVVVAAADARAETPELTRCLADAGYGDLLPRLLTPEEVQEPLAAEDPWEAMLARHGATPIPRGR